MVVFALLDYILPTMVSYVPDSARFLLPDLPRLRVSYLNLPAVYESHYCAISSPMSKMQDCIISDEFAFRQKSVGILLSIIGSFTLYLAMSWVNDNWTNINSSIISTMVKLSEQIPFPRKIRSIFIGTPIPKAGYVQNHSHPTAARERNSASTFADSFSRLIGRKAYFVQKSESDVNKNREGSRTYFWDRDVNVEYEKFAPTSDHMLYYSDVDYYLDMRKMITDNYSIHLISTFTPTSVSEDSGEYNFTFNENSEVYYKVSGGAKYQHKVWNYATDVLSCKTKLWWALGLVNYNVIYNVERKELDKHHSIILLSPLKRYYGFFWLHTEGHELQYLSCVTGDFLRMQIMDKSGMKISTGKVMNYYSTTIPIAWDESIATASYVSVTKMTPGLLRTICSEIKLDQTQAYLLVDYHNTKSAWGGPTVYPIDSSVYNYEYTVPYQAGEGRPTVTPFMNPFILDCYAPTSSKNNEVRAIEGRVLELRKHNKPRSAFMTQCIMEFVDKLVPNKHIGYPVGYKEIYDRQKRASQQSILHRAAEQVSLPIKKACGIFIKRETYQGIKDPRIITTYDGKVKLEYSAFIYAFTEHVIAHQEWYAFAKTPLEIAGLVSKICMAAKFNVVSTDLSRMDGHVNEDLRDLERMAMLAYFARETHEELLELIDAQQNNDAYTNSGLSFFMAVIRGSGSLETAVMNSTDNKFMAFYEKRKSGMSIDDAWDSPGIYGGDDGLTSDANPATYETACAECGQVLTSEVFKIGDRGVNFLARIYSPSIWTGDLDSMCDLRRQLAKFHTTTNIPGNITPMQKLVEKCASYILTDENTPVIGEICKAVAMNTPLFRDLNPNMRGIASYFGKYTKDVQFPNRNVGGWMENEFYLSMPDFDYGLFKQYISGVIAGTTDPLKPYLCENQKKLTSPVSAIVNGLSVGVDTPKTAIPLPSAPPLKHWIVDKNTGEKLQPTINVDTTKLDLDAFKTPPTEKKEMSGGVHFHFSPPPAFSPTFDPNKPYHPNQFNPFLKPGLTNPFSNIFNAANKGTEIESSNQEPHKSSDSVSSSSKSKAEKEDGEITEQEVQTTTNIN